MIVRANQLTQRPSRKGFTLLEILLVVAIIVVLAGLAVVYLMPAFMGAQEDIARTKAISLGQAAQMYYIKHGSYPNDLTELTQPDPKNDNKPFIKAEAINDPWGKPYQINAAGPNHHGAEPDIFTTNAKGETIGNWAPPK